MTSAGLDSVTLIHAFKEFVPGISYSQLEREMAGRAKILIHNLHVEGATIVVPAVVISEYLSGVDSAHHEKTIAAFRDSFEIPPFDLKSVSIAAKLWQAHRSLPVAEQLGRIVLKADVLIIATMKAFGVSHYYSNDAKSRTLAKQAGLIPHDLPERSPYLIPEVVEQKKKRAKSRERPENDPSKEMQ